MCERSAVASVALAVLLGLAAFPLVLVFGPVYFPWSVLVLASFGGVVGLATASTQQLLWLRSLALAALMIVAIVGALTLSSNIVLSPNFLASTLLWMAWLFLPVFVGVSAGTALRMRMGVVRGAALGAASVVAIAVAGAVLAFAFAPAEVADAPKCVGGFECPRTFCAYMAERRRLFAVERVTRSEGNGITCTYTAWGGVPIGRVDADARSGSWTDGWWPELVLGRAH